MTTLLSAPERSASAPGSARLGVTLGWAGVGLALLAAIANILIGAFTAISPLLILPLMFLPIPGLASAAIGMAFGGRQGVAAGCIAIVVTYLGIAIGFVTMFLQ